MENDNKVYVADLVRQLHAPDITEFEIAKIERKLEILKDLG